MARVISISNQKGGVAKTFSTLMIGLTMARNNKKVLVIDCDNQGSLTLCCGLRDPRQHTITLADLIDSVINGDGDLSLFRKEDVLYKYEGMDVIPSDIRLSKVEREMDVAMNRDCILRSVVDYYRDDYDVILLDTGPHLGTMLVNALSASDSVIIPTEPEFLSVEGMNILIGDIVRVKRLLNPGLEIEGILITKVVSGSAEAKEFIPMIREAYKDKIKVFESEIPISDKAKTATRMALNMHDFSPRSHATLAYAKLVKELSNSGI